MAGQTICMGCGQATGPEPRLNVLPNGRPCAACADRLLDTLPPLLPSPDPDLASAGEEWAGEGEEPGEDYPRGA